MVQFIILITYYITIVTGVYKPSYNWGGHIAELGWIGYVWKQGRIPKLPVRRENMGKMLMNHVTSVCACVCVCHGMEWGTLLSAKTNWWNQLLKGTLTGNLHFVYSMAKEIVWTCFTVFLIFMEKQPVSELETCQKPEELELDRMT